LKKSCIKGSSFLNNYSIINNKQHSFSKGKSRNTAIAEFIKRVYKLMDEREISIGFFWTAP
jgi:hypothetical protein